MTVSSATSSASSPNILTRLQTNGLSASKAQLVGDDLVDAVDEVADANGGIATDDKVRDVLDKRIADDVASGRLSKEDAAKVAKTLDQLEGVDGDDSPDDVAGAPDGVQGAGGPAGGGGAAGGEATKTELSRTVTVVGSIKTTTITYTDGTSDTETGVATPADQDRYCKSGAADSDADTAQAYLSTIEPGTLVDRTA